MSGDHRALGFARCFVALLLFHVPPMLAIDTYLESTQVLPLSPEQCLDYFVVETIFVSSLDGFIVGSNTPCFRPMLDV